MKRKLLAAVLMGTLLLSGCGSGGKTDLMKDVKASEIPAEPVAAQTVSEGAAVTELGLDLLRAGHSEGNTLISPVSIAYALAMTANGARGETLTQMEEVLGAPVETLNYYFYDYLRALPEDGKNTLHLANSIWFTDEESFTVEPAFLQTNADYYGADIYRTALDESAKNAINGWVKDNTKGMIPEIVDQIPENAVMYLVNALAFDGEWSAIYKETQVQPGTFTTEDGRRQETELMWSEEHRYLQGELATGVMKSYKGGEYAFAALLPHEGVSVEELVESLTGEELRRILRTAESQSVTTAIPRFETAYDTELSELLMALGMTDAFDYTVADFSGLGSSTEGNIVIDRVLHRTYLAVDEKGTKAGAATAVEMAKETAAMEPEEPKRVILDRPFLCMIVDCEENLPLFLGTVMEVN